MMVSRAAAQAGVQTGLRRYGMKANPRMRTNFIDKHPAIRDYFLIAGGVGAFAGIMEGFEAIGDLKNPTPSIAYGAIMIHSVLGIAKGPFLPLYYLFARAMHLRNDG